MLLMFDRVTTRCWARGRVCAVEHEHAPQRMAAARSGTDRAWGGGSAAARSSDAWRCVARLVARVEEPLACPVAEL